MAPTQLHRLQDRHLQGEEAVSAPALAAMVELDHVRALPSFECVVVLAFYWGGLTPTQIAQACRSSRRTVAAALGRAHGRLRARVDGVAGPAGKKRRS